MRDLGASTEERLGPIHSDRSSRASPGASRRESPFTPPKGRRPCGQRPTRLFRANLAAGGDSLPCSTTTPPPPLPRGVRCKSGKGRGSCSRALRLRLAGLRGRRLGRWLDAARVASLDSSNRSGERARRSGPGVSSAPMLCACGVVTCHVRAFAGSCRNGCRANSPAHAPSCSQRRGQGTDSLLLRLIEVGLAVRQCLRECLRRCRRDDLRGLLSHRSPPRVEPIHGKTQGVPARRDDRPEAVGPSCTEERQRRTGTPPCRSPSQFDALRVSHDAGVDAAS